jgi:ankyrin repeat protein
MHDLDPQIMTLIHAIQDRDLDAVKAALDATPDLAGHPAPGGGTPLLLAAYMGFAEAIDLLVAAHPRLSLCEAAAIGDVARMRAILAKDPAQLGAYSGDGWTALHLAGFFGHEAIAKELLMAGADVHAVSTNAMANRPLHASLAGTRAPGVIKALLAAGAQVNALAAGNVTPLHLAASRGDGELIELLLAAGADRGARMDDGQTPAELGASRGHAAVVAAAL